MAGAKRVLAEIGLAISPLESTKWDAAGGGSCCQANLGVRSRANVRRGRETSG